MKIVAVLYYLGLMLLAPISLCAQKQPINFDDDKVYAEVTLNGIPRLMNLSFRGHSVIYSPSGNIPKSPIVLSETTIFDDSLLKFRYFPRNCICDTLSAGTLGNVLRKNSTYILDFENSLLSEISSLTDSELQERKFKEIKSIFYRDRLEIVVNINWKDYSFIFDLSYAGTFSHSLDRKLLEKLGEGYRYNVSRLNLPNAEYLVFPFSKIYINKIGYSSALKVGDQIENRVGTGFIKGFTWIIDYSKKKVYFKKNSIALATNTFEADLQTGIRDEKLTITALKQGLRKFKLGDVITAVNNEYVTSANICHLQDFINSMKNSAELNLKFASEN